MAGSQIIYAFLTNLLQKLDAHDQVIEEWRALSQQIQNTLTNLQSNLTEDTQKALFEADLTTIKQQLQAVGYEEVLEDPVWQQIEQLVTALKNQQLAAIGKTFETLAVHFDESEQPADAAEIITSLEKHIPKSHLDQIELRLKNANPGILHQTLQEVAHRFKVQPENVDLDAIVQVFDKNLGNLFGHDEAQKEAQRMEEYRLSARQSILKSLKANGIQPPEE